METSGGDVEQKGVLIFPSISTPLYNEYTNNLQMRNRFRFVRVAFRIRCCCSLVVVNARRLALLLPRREKSTI
jgi:hypothetical protein